MESDADQHPLSALSTVRYYLSVICLGWYAIHWFIQLVGLYAASVSSPIAITVQTMRAHCWPSSP